MKWFWIWWLGLALLGTAGLGFYRQGSLLGELEQAGSALAAEAAQRADQHDAHLTALSAIAQADKTDSSAFLEVVDKTLPVVARQQSAADFLRRAGVAADEGNRAAVQLRRQRAHLR